MASSRKNNVWNRQHDQAYREWYDRLHGKHGRRFDASLFARLAREQWQHYPALADAWLRCTMEWPRSALYTYFMPPLHVQQHWKFAGSLFLEHPTLGAVLVDILRDGSIGGMEYFERAVGWKVDIGKEEEYRLKHTARVRAQQHAN